MNPTHIRYIVNRPPNSALYTDPRTQSNPQPIQPNPLQRGGLSVGRSYPSYSPSQSPQHGHYSASPFVYAGAGVSTSDNNVSYAGNAGAPPLSTMKSSSNGQYPNVWPGQRMAYAPRVRQPQSKAPQMYPGTPPITTNYSQSPMHKPTGTYPNYQQSTSTMMPGSTPPFICMSQPKKMKFGTFHGEHGATILPLLNKDRNEEDSYCDAVLQVKGESFNVHRFLLGSLSSYFNKLFKCEMKEKYVRTVDLTKFSAKTIRAVLDFVYTANITITEENALLLLEAADYFLLYELQTFCSKFLISTLTVLNCLHLRSIGEVFHCKPLQSSSEEVVVKHFRKVVKQPNFKELSSNDLKAIIQALDQTVMGSKPVYEGILTWVHHDYDGRKPFFADLFKYLKLHLLPTKYLQERVTQQELVKSSHVCKDHFLSETLYAMEHQNRKEPIFESNSCSENEDNGESEKCSSESLDQEPEAPQQAKQRGGRMGSRGSDGLHVDEGWTKVGLQQKPIRYDPQKMKLSKNLEEFYLANIQPHASETLSTAEVTFKSYVINITKQLKMNKSHDALFEWIEANVKKEERSQPIFIRALTTATCQDGIKQVQTGRGSHLQVDKGVIKRHSLLLKKYIDDDSKELQAVYALQKLFVDLEQPPNILKLLFDYLYDEYVISEQTFFKWEKDEDATECDGKGVALLSVNPFFTWLREAEVESDE